MIKMLLSLHHHACFCSRWCFSPAASPGVLLHGGQRNPDRRPLPGRVPPQRARRHAQVSPHEGQSDVRVRPWGRARGRDAPRARRIRPRIPFFVTVTAVTFLSVSPEWRFSWRGFTVCTCIRSVASSARLLPPDGAVCQCFSCCVSVFRLLFVSPIVPRQMALWLWGKNSQQWRS